MALSTPTATRLTTGGPLKGMKAAAAPTTSAVAIADLQRLAEDCFREHMKAHLRGESSVFDRAKEYLTQRLTALEKHGLPRSRLDSARFPDDPEPDSTEEERLGRERRDYLVGAFAGFCAMEGFPAQLREFFFRCASERPMPAARGPGAMVIDPEMEPGPDPLRLPDVACVWFGPSTTRDERQEGAKEANERVAQDGYTAWIAGVPTDEAHKRDMLILRTMEAVVEKHFGQLRSKHNFRVLMHHELCDRDEHCLHGQAGKKYTVPPCPDYSVNTIKSWTERRDCGHHRRRSGARA